MTVCYYDYLLLWLFVIILYLSCWRQTGRDFYFYYYYCSCCCYCVPRAVTGGQTEEAEVPGGPAPCDAFIIVIITVFHVLWQAEKQKKQKFMVAPPTVVKEAPKRRKPPPRVRKPWVVLSTAFYPTLAVPFHVLQTFPLVVSKPNSSNSGFSAFCPSWQDLVNSCLQAQFLVFLVQLSARRDKTLLHKCNTACVE